MIMLVIDVLVHIVMNAMKRTYVIWSIEHVKDN